MRCFLDNATTALVMAPIAALAICATSPSLLDGRRHWCLMRLPGPIGHQCNMVVMVRGRPPFSDYRRFGLPLSFLVIAVAVPMLMVVWPMR